MQEISSLRSSSVCLRTRAGLPRPHLGALKLQEEKQGCVSAPSPLLRRQPKPGPTKATRGRPCPTPACEGAPGYKGVSMGQTGRVVLATLPIRAQLWEEKTKNKYNHRLRNCSFFMNGYISRVWLNSARQTNRTRARAPEEQDRRTAGREGVRDGAGGSG